MEQEGIERVVSYTVATLEHNPEPMSSGPIGHVFGARDDRHESLQATLPSMTDSKSMITQTLTCEPASAHLSSPPSSRCLATSPCRGEGAFQLGPGS